MNLMIDILRLPTTNPQVNTPRLGTDTRTSYPSLSYVTSLQLWCPPQVLCSAARERVAVSLSLNAAGLFEVPSLFYSLQLRSFHSSKNNALRKPVFSRNGGSVGNPNPNPNSRCKGGQMSPSKWHSIPLSSDLVERFNQSSFYSLARAGA